MLALLSVAHGTADPEGESGSLLVFDEIDAGIGGHTARAVGEQGRATGPELRYAAPLVGVHRVDPGPASWDRAVP